MTGVVILLLGPGGPDAYCLSFPVFQKKLGSSYWQRIYLGRETVQLVNHLPCKQKDLSLIPEPKWMCGSNAVSPVWSRRGGGDDTKFAGPLVLTGWLA